MAVAVIGEMKPSLSILRESVFAVLGDIFGGYEEKCIGNLGIL